MPTENFVFKKHDMVLLVSKTGKKWMVRIDDKKFDTHLGMVNLSDIEGKHAGEHVTTSKGHVLYCMLPTLADFVLLMKRKAQIIYPKDLGPIIFYGDVKSGQTVLEAGTGSGALTIALLKAVGANGKVISVERRNDFGKIALKNIEKYFGKIPENLKLIMGDISTIQLKNDVERVFLDLPEPWKAIENVSRCLVGGGILVNYSPNVGQVQLVVKELRKHHYTDIFTIEVLEREWIIDEKRARPKDRMVAHTGFITIARKAKLE